MIQEGPHIKKRENLSHKQSTKSSLSLRPNPVCHRGLSLSITWEPRIFRENFLHLVVPCPCKHSILFYYWMCQDEQNWAAVLPSSSHHSHKYFHVPCLGEKGCSPVGKILTWSVMGHSYHPVWAPGLHWSGSDTSLFRLWRPAHPMPQGEVLQWASQPTALTMRRLLIPNWRASTTQHMTFRRMVPPFSQGLHGKDALLRLRNTVPAVWRATITEKKPKTKTAGTDVEPSALREGVVADRSLEHLVDRQHGLKTCQTKERLKIGLLFSRWVLSLLTYYWRRSEGERQ